MRHLNIEITLFFLLLFLRAVNWEYLATKQPNFLDLTEGETDPILRFANTTFLWLAISLIQVINCFHLFSQYFLNFSKISIDNSLNLINHCS